MGIFDLGATSQGVGGFADVFTPMALSEGGTTSDANKALSPEAMAKILGLFSGASGNQAALINARKPVYGPGAPNPGHVGPTQLKSPEKATASPQGVVPSLADVLGFRS